MNSETVKLDEFTVVGISVRTSNQDGRSKKDISGLWEAFMRDHVAEKVPHKVNKNLYCIYTDYESDYMGPYTTILGVEVRSIENIPDGLIARTFPAGTYQPFISMGKLPDCVLNTWKYIWDSGIKRKYLSDFDVYPPDAFSSENPVVETYLSV